MAKSRLKPRDAGFRAHLALAFKLPAFLDQPGSPENASPSGGTVRLAQLVEPLTLGLGVVHSCPTSGVRDYLSHHPLNSYSTYLLYGSPSRRHRFSAVGVQRQKPVKVPHRYRYGIPSNGWVEKGGKSEISNPLPQPHVHISSCQEEENTLNYTWLILSWNYIFGFCTESQDRRMTFPLNSALRFLISTPPPRFYTDPGAPPDWMKLLSKETTAISRAKPLESGGVSGAKVSKHKKDTMVLMPKLYLDPNELCMERSPELLLASMETTDQVSQGSPPWSKNAAIAWFWDENQFQPTILDYSVTCTRKLTIPFPLSSIILRRKDCVDALEAPEPFF